MIREIYDYLLIRHILLTNSKEELLQDTNNKEMYDLCVKVISKLMQSEDFVLIFNDVQEKVDELIKKYRFDYVDKNNMEDINYIIGRLRDYSNKSEAEVERLRIDFYLEEFKDRDLSMKYTFHKEGITEMIINDFIVYSSFTNLEEDDKPFEISVDIDHFTSTINLLISRFPDFFTETNIAPYLIHILNQIKKTRGVKYFTKSYVARTIEYLNSIEEKNKEKRLDF